MSSRTFPSTGEKPKFDPNAAYEAVEEGPRPKGTKPKFDPNKQFHAVSEEPATESLQQPKQEQLAFVPMTDWLTIQSQAPPMVAENVINDHDAKVALSKERVNAHLTDVDNSIHNLIHDRKKDLQSRIISEQLGLNPKETGPINPQAQLLESRTRKDIPVYPEEINETKSRMANDVNTARIVLNQKAKDLNEKDPVASKQLKADIYRLDRQNEPSKDDKISKNIEKIKNGDLDYDIAHGVLTKPVGFFGGLIEGFTQKKKSFEDYDIYSSGDEAAIIKNLNEKIKYDPDKPTVIGTEGFANILPGGEAGMMTGGQPIKPLAAGALAGWVGGPEAGTAAMSLVSGPEMYKLGYANSLPQNYAAIKQHNPNISDVDAYHKAAELADKQAAVEGATGIAMGALGGEFAFRPTGLSTGLLQKSVGNALRQLGEEGAKKGLEGLGVGVIGATGQAVKNLIAQKAGLPTETTEGMAEQLKSGVAMTVGMAIAAKVPKLLNPKTYNQLFQGLSKQPEPVIAATLEGLQKSGYITPEEAQQVQSKIKEHQELDNSIKPNVPESDRIKVQELIKKRNDLEGSLETMDKAYHKSIKNQIDKINEQILSISEGRERGELQTIIDKEIKSGKGDKKVLSGLADKSENEIKLYMKDVAANSNDPIMIEILGENIVNKAKELYPQEQPKESKISVIKSEEIKRPETTTIAPAETGAGKVPEEQIGHVEISEHGEDTKTKEGLENGIEPSKLSEEGIKEAKELGQYLIENKKNKIVTSEIERAKQTSEEAAKEVKSITGKEIPVEPNKVLNTWDIGEYDGKPEGSFVEEAWVNKPNEAPKGGESFNDFTNRMEQAYQYVKSLPEDNHVISHSKVMRALSALEKTGGKWTDETTKDFLTNKELTHAIQEPSTSGVLQYPQEGTGIEGSERGTLEPGEQGEVPAGTRPEEEGKTPGAQKEVGKLSVDEVYELPFIEEPSDKKTGIKNIISKTTRFERKLPEVEVGKLGSDQEILLEGKSLVDNNVINPLDVVNRILDTKEGMQPDEAKAMQYYMHQLAQHETNLREQLARATNETEQAEINGQLQQLSDEVDAATQANIISGKAWSDVGNIRQIVSDTGFNASRDLATIKDAYGGKIPKDVQARLDKVTKERNDALNRLAKLEEIEKNKAAEETIKKEGGPKNTKKTKEQFKSERNDIKQTISDKLKQARSGESGLTAVPLPFAKELIAISPEIFKLIKSYAEEGIQKTEEVINRLHELLKDEIDGVSKADIVNLLAGKYKEEERKLSPVAQRVRDYRTEASLWTKIEEAIKMEEDTPAKKEEKNEKLRMLRERLNDIKKKNKEAIKSAKEILETDAQKEIKRLSRQRRALESKYKNKKYLVPSEKASPPVTQEIIKEKQRIVNANYKIRIEKRRAFESKKNFYQKSLMWIGRGVRLSVLSGYNVLAKLTAAATIGGAVKRIPEQAIGFIYGNAFKGIAERAPIEGFVNAAAEAKFYKEFFNPKTFVKNTWEILKSGESPLSKKFSPGTYEHIPGLYLPTDLHQVIKDPVKRATYEASLKNALAWAERNGMDINDDLVIQSLEIAAYKRAQYEIFQEQNWLSKKFGEWKHNMEEAGNLGATGKFLADFMIPVSTVPTNIGRRMVTTSPFGLIRGGAKVIEAYRNGIEKLTPEQADSVMRQLKQGTLGTALWLIGWYGYSQFGGLYSKFNPNKQRDQGDLVSDEMSVGGKMIPKPVQHAIPLEIIQFAATARRVYENYKDNKGASTPEAIEKAGLASIGALTEQIPVVETVAHTIGAFTNPYEAKKLEEDVKRRFQPQILRETGIIEKEEKGSGGGAGASGHYRESKTMETKYKTPKYK